MAEFWNTLLQNVVLLLILMPLVGAALVRVVASAGVEAVRRTALTNILLSLVLTGAMVASFEPAITEQTGFGDSLQMTSNFRWLAEIRPSGEQSGSDAQVWVSRYAGPNVRFAVGVDGLNLWLVASVAVLIGAVALGTPTESRAFRRPAAYFPCLLGLESSLVGVLAAQDVVLFCLFLQLTTLCFFLLIGWWGGYERRPAAARLIWWQLTASLLILLGLMALVLTFSWMMATERNPHPELTFSIPTLIGGINYLADSNELAAQFWYQTGPWIFLAFLLGFSIQLSVVPFHAWFPAAQRQALPFVGVLLTGGLLHVGCYGFLRFVLPLFAEICLQAADVLTWTTLVLAGLAALLALAQREWKPLIAYASMSQMALCLLGIWTLDRLAVAGSLLYLLHHALAAGFLFVLLGIAERRGGCFNDGPTTLWKDAPVFATLLVLGTLALVGVPGTGGFASGVLIVFGLFRFDPALAAWSLVATVVLAWALISMLHHTLAGTEPASLFELLSGQSSHKRRTAPVESESYSKHGGSRLQLTSSEWAALLPLAVLTVGMGIVPQLFLTRMEPGVSKILRGVERPPFVLPEASSRRHVD